MTDVERNQVARDLLLIALAHGDERTHEAIQRIITALDIRLEFEAQVKHYHERASQRKGDQPWPQ